MGIFAFVAVVTAAFVLTLRGLPRRIGLFLLLAFLLQGVLILSADLFGVTLLPLLPDEINYHTYATQFLETGKIPSGEYAARRYSYLIAGIYRLTGSSMAAGRFLNGAISLASIGVLYRLVRRYDTSPSTAGAVLILFLTLLPTRIFYHTALLREAIVFGLLVVAIYLFSSSLARTARARSVPLFLLSALALFGVYLFRSENLYVFGGVLLLLPVVSPRSLLSERTSGILAILGAVAVFVGFQTVGVDQLIGELNQFVGNMRPRARLYDLGREYDSILDVVLATPYRAALYVIAPDPFTPSHYRYLLPTLTSAYIVAFLLACFGMAIVAGRSPLAGEALASWSEYRLTLTVLGVTGVVGIAFYSLAEPNFRVAPRHRLQFTWMLYTLLVLGLFQGRRLSVGASGLRVRSLTYRRRPRGDVPRAGDAEEPVPEEPVDG